MLTYHYRCTSCTGELTLKKSIKEASPTTCPDCHTETLEAVCHAVAVIDMTPRTLGSQADHNHAKAGAYEREAKQYEIASARQRAKAENLPEGMESIRNPSPSEKLWWRPGQTQINPALVRAAPDAKRQYLEQGDL